MGKKRKKKRYAEGLLEKTKRGFGFVIQEERDIYIPRNGIGGAMDGDLVRVEIVSSPRGMKLEGRITKVLKRNTETVVGRLEKKDHRGYVVPIGKHGRDILFIRKGNFLKAANGDIVEASIVKYPDGDNYAEGKVRHIIAKAGAADGEPFFWRQGYETGQGTGEELHKQPGERQISFCA